MKKLWLAAMVAAVVASGLPAHASRPSIRYVCFDRTAELTRPDRRGVIRGTHRDDVIITRAARAIVLGGGGNDRICTGRGANFIGGGDGHDLMSAAGGSDRIDGGEGDDYLSGRGGSDELNGGYGSDSLVGASGDDRLVGGHDARDFLFGGGGDDQLVGGEGTADGDFLVGGDGADLLEGGQGPGDTVSFAFESAAVVVDLAAQGAPLPSGDVLESIENIDGSLGSDVISGDGNSNQLEGDDGDDTINGEVGSDSIDGGLGDDALDGGDGVDFLSFLSSPVGVDASLIDQTASGSGADVLSGLEHLQGSAHDDTLTGDDGVNHLFGSRGYNVVDARDGDDQLHDAQAGDAGAGTDFCMNSFEIPNCEQYLHGDPSAFSTITSPSQEARLAISSFRSIEGAVSGGAFGPKPERVQVALRRLTAAGCSWWSAQRGSMVAGHCERPLWSRAELDRRSGTWTQRIKSPAQFLNAGRYQVRSRIHQPGYSEGPHPIYNVIDFRLQ